MTADENGGGSASGDLFSLGLALAAAVVIPLVIGILVDARARSTPVGFLLGLALGIAGAVAILVARVRRSQ